MLDQPFRLAPQYRDYVWGGAHLRPNIVPTAEAWVVYEDDLVVSGPFEGRTLKDLVKEFSTDLLGSRASLNQGNRFPILVKLLDCAQWLSLQVHPDDEQAVALEGPGYFGKTEAWHVLNAEPDAKLIAGIQPGVNAGSLADSISNGTILNKVRTFNVSAGDTILIRPGTIHALGPGLLIYEIQQTSDLTYRVYDWGRPQTEQRKLHIDKATLVSHPDAAVTVLAKPALADGEMKIISKSEYFSLELIHAKNQVVLLNTLGETFHALTVIEGKSRVEFSNQVVELGLFETIVVPAACGAYRLQPLESCRILKAGL